MKRGRPIKPESEKAKTTKPSLRILKDKWEKFKSTFPGKANRMFNDWVDDQLKNK